MQTNTELQAIKPHIYPIWIWGFFIIIIALIVINCRSLPYYIKNARYIHEGKQLLKNGDIEEALDNFNQIASNLELPKETKLYLARQLFKRDDEGDRELAVYYLIGLSLTDKEFDRLSEVMPDNVKSLFQKEKR
ncbi:MAG: hypothetical protein HRU35_02685 [Rickettsiaceae bacterium]|nr:hypothetical protein [Rickettsiaceae bacterium]